MSTPDTVSGLPAPGTLWEWPGFPGVNQGPGTYAVAAVYRDERSASGHSVLLVRFDPALPVVDCDVLRCGSWPWSFTPSKKVMP